MEGCRVGDGDRGAAGHARDACRTYCHGNACHLEGCQCAGARWFNLRRTQGIWAAYENFYNTRIGMIEIQRPGTGKGVGFRRLARANTDTCTCRGVSIVHRVQKLDCPTSSTRRNVEGSGVVLRSSLVIKYREEKKPKGGTERCPNR